MVHFNCEGGVPSDAEVIQSDYERITEYAAMRISHEVREMHMLYRIAHPSGDPTTFINPKFLEWYDSIVKKAWDNEQERIKRMEILL